MLQRTTRLLLDGQEANRATGSALLHRCLREQYCTDFSPLQCNISNHGIKKVCSITHKAACRRVLAVCIQRGHKMARRQRGESLALDHEVTFAIRQKCAGLFTNEGCKSRIALRTSRFTPRTSAVACASLVSASARAWLVGLTSKRSPSPRASIHAAALHAFP